MTFLDERDFMMDKKVKKKTHVLQQRIQALRQQLAGAKKQMDDPGELKSIEQQLAAAEVEMVLGAGAGAAGVGSALVVTLAVDGMVIFSPQAGQSIWEPAPV